MFLEQFPRSLAILATLGAMLVAMVMARPTAVPPVVVMHGILGADYKMQDVADWIHESLPNTYVKLAEVGNGPVDSIFMDMNKQVEIFCEEIYSDPLLKDGFNLIGFSQGGLVARGYIQRCNKYPVVNFLSWASPQGGVFGTADYVPPWLVFLLHEEPYNKLIQESLSVAQYWKDPYNLKEFVNGSTFLADLNNVRDVKNETYKQQITSLNTMMLLYSPNDEIVAPPSSGWFDFWEPYSGPGPYGRVQRVQDTPFYQEDWIGLRTLAESGRLQFHQSNCSHEDHPKESCKHAFELFSLPILQQPWEQVHRTWKPRN